MATYHSIFEILCLIFLSAGTQAKDQKDMQGHFNFSGLIMKISNNICNAKLFKDTDYIMHPDKPRCHVKYNR